MNRFIVFFFVILHLVYGLDECFNVQNNVIQNGKTLTIRTDRVLPMCNCYNNELEQYKSSTETLILEDNVISIGSNCFSGFEKLKTINFGKSIEEIKQYAFTGTGINELVIPASVKVIESYAFADNKELENIEFQDSNENVNELEINEFAFQNCVKLNKVTLSKKSKNFSFSNSVLFLTETRTSLLRRRKSSFDLKIKLRNSK